MNAMQGALREAIGENKLDIIDATGIASVLMGDSIATNAFMLGFAFQKGAIPLSLEAILRAIEINGAAIEMNKQAFSWGRLAAYDISRVRSVTQFRARASAPARGLDDAITHRAAFLVAYQNQGYADRYLAMVSAARKAEAAVAPGSSEFTEAVAKNLFKLMAYKDEYEVARLYTDGSFADKLKTQFDGDFRMKFHLAPPLFARRDKVTGRPRKSEYGGWTIHLFGLLARLKFLRGTALDPFGYSPERKAERQLIADYEAMLRQHTPTLQNRDLPTLVKLARIPEMIRGYGYVKDESIQKASQQRSRLLADLDNHRFAVAAE
jgi:indolepyruvate ferredoxin oxidoreductase